MNNKCSLCKVDEESTNHMFIYHKRIKKMWDMLLAILASMGISKFYERASLRLEGERHRQKTKDLSLPPLRPLA